MSPKIRFLKYFLLLTKNTTKNISRKITEFQLPKTCILFTINVLTNVLTMSASQGH